jgi:hypothetical protein
MVSYIRRGHAVAFVLDLLHEYTIALSICKQSYRFMNVLLLGHLAVFCILTVTWRRITDCLLHCLFVSIKLARKHRP